MAALLFFSQGLHHEEGATEASKRNTLSSEVNHPSAPMRKFQVASDCPTARNLTINRDCGGPFDLSGVVCVLRSRPEVQFGLDLLFVAWSASASVVTVPPSTCVTRTAPSQC